MNEENARLIEERDHYRAVLAELFECIRSGVLAVSLVNVEMTKIDRVLAAIEATKAALQKVET